MPCPVVFQTQRRHSARCHPPLTINSSRSKAPSGEMAGWRVGQHMLNRVKVACESDSSRMIGRGSPASQQPQRFLDSFEMVGAERAIAIHQPPGRDGADLVDQQIGIVFELAGFLHSYP